LPKRAAVRIRCATWHIEMSQKKRSPIRVGRLRAMDVGGTMDFGSLGKKSFVIYKGDFVLTIVS